ncbi:hypothetical protein WH7805_11538 [Synechococcus sp. WH 7805]|nr:hypothetical protein WH7805_11538 [Synechococcus sp. WH 7805]
MHEINAAFHLAVGSNVLQDQASQPWPRAIFFNTNRSRFMPIGNP